MEQWLGLSVLPELSTVHDPIIKGRGQADHTFCSLLRIHDTTSNYVLFYSNKKPLDIVQRLYWTLLAVSNCPFCILLVEQSNFGCANVRFANILQSKDIVWVGLLQSSFIIVVVVVVGNDDDMTSLGRWSHPVIELKTRNKPRQLLYVYRFMLEYSLNFIPLYHYYVIRLQWYSSAIRQMVMCPSGSSRFSYYMDTLLSNYPINLYISQTVKTSGGYSCDIN